MRNFCILGMLLWTVVHQSALNAGEALAPELAPLAPFVGKTWRSEAAADGGDQRSQIDVSRWERALNGQAIRILHSINDGEYGGETMLLWDRNRQSLVFYYFTTAGFFTEGTARIVDGRFVSTEQIHGNADGITEVEAVAELDPSGRLISRSRYLKNGEWIDGHSFSYVQAPDAEVRFR